MKFSFFIKDREAYKRIEIDLPENAGWEFIKSLKMTVEEQLNNIREDIVNLFPETNRNDINFINPRSEEKEIQNKIDSLVSIRKVNSDMKNYLTLLLSDDEFIFCKHCKSKMYKVPIGVKYYRFGNKYIISEESLNNRWVYMCKNCWYAIDEDIYNYVNNNISQRKLLLEQGYNFVPDKFGFWHWEDIPNAKGKHPDMKDAEGECVHSWRRIFEDIDINLGLYKKQKFVKITKVCGLCGKKECVK
jgi:hypothetical protein